jgi:hypothetical protein
MKRQLPRAVSDAGQTTDVPGGHLPGCPYRPHGMAGKKQAANRADVLAALHGGIMQPLSALTVTWSCDAERMASSPATQA